MTFIHKWIYLHDIYYTQYVYFFLIKIKTLSQEILENHLKKIREEKEQKIRTNTVDVKGKHLLNFSFILFLGSNFH